MKVKTYKRPIKKEHQEILERIIKYINEDQKHNDSSNWTRKKGAPTQGEKR